MMTSSNKKSNGDIIICDTLDECHTFKNHFALPLLGGSLLVDMEESEARDVFNYLVLNYIPERLKGNANREKFKTWKKKVKKITISKKIEENLMSFENSKMLKERQGKMVIWVKKSDLEEIWKKIHVDMGHIGRS